jgi:hypothetical protein
VAVVVGVTALPRPAMRMLRPAWFAGDGRSVPTQLADELNRTMRVRARGLHAVEHMPSLRDRLLAGLPTTYRARVAGRGA